MPTLRPTLHLDRLGSVIAVLIGAALFASPFVTYRANRIVSGEGRPLIDALPPAGATAVAVVVLGVALCAVLAHRPLVRLAAASLGLGVIFPAVGLSAGFVTPAGNTFARVSPSVGFWLLALAFGLLAADALTRLRFGPWARLAALTASGARRASICGLPSARCWPPVSSACRSERRAIALARFARRFFRGSASCRRSRASRSSAS
jgi:osmoprotectant transport system permease protein